MYIGNANIARGTLHRRRTYKWRRSGGTFYTQNGGVNTAVLTLSAANVGIGTTSPATMLSVAGNGYLPAARRRRREHDGRHSADFGQRNNRRQRRDRHHFPLQSSRSLGPRHRLHHRLRRRQQLLDHRLRRLRQRQRHLLGLDLPVVRPAIENRHHVAGRLVISVSNRSTQSRLLLPHRPVEHRREPRLYRAAGREHLP